ncbi:hypothetical protein [Rhodococcus zopfii]|nr:hypothetical protein [Rhodococcus zopfii]
MATRRLKCRQRLGCVAKLDDVPAVVVEHVRIETGLAAWWPRASGPS